jgi:hypothetical protein
MTKMLEGVDAEVFSRGLAQRPEVVWALLSDPACVLAAPVLAAKLASAGVIDAGSVVPVLVERLQQESAPLGVKQLARALLSCANDLRSPLANTEQLASTLSDLAVVGRFDEATRRFLMESVYALRS